MSITNSTLRKLLLETRVKKESESLTTQQSTTRSGTAAVGYGCFQPDEGVGGGVNGSDISGGGCDRSRGGISTGGRSFADPLTHGVCGLRGSAGCLSGIGSRLSGGGSDLCGVSGRLPGVPDDLCSFFCSLCRILSSAGRFSGGLCMCDCCLKRYDGVA